MDRSFSHDGADQPPLDWRALAVEPTESTEGHCDCCGTATRRVWGYVSHGGQAMAAYFVSWTLGRADHGARFEVILGAWGEGTAAADRAWAALDYRVVEGESAFMVVDAPNPDDARSGIAATALRRDEVIGTPLAPQVFAITDAVIMNDGRLAELRDWA